MNVTSSPAQPGQSTPPAPSFALIVTVAASFGLICGLAEALIYWGLSIVPDPLGWRNDLLPEILWIAPAVNSLLFAAVGGLTAAASRLCRLTRAALPVYYALFGAGAIYAPLAAMGRLRPLTCVLLATGVSVQLYRYTRTHHRAPMLLRRALAAAALGVLLGGSWSTLASRGLGIAGTTPAAPRAEPPNILLVVLDTLRADHVSAYGYERLTTPHLDSLARQGALFERAFASDSWTLPSHASIMTGRYTHEHRAGGSPLGGRYPTLAEYLSGQGYATAGFVANNYYCSARSGLARGFTTYEDHFESAGDMVVHTVYGKLLGQALPWLGYYDIPGRKRALAVNREFWRWLDSRRPAPFFAFLNYLDVHDPYLAPAPYDRRFSDYPCRGDRVNSELFPRDFTGGRQLSPAEVQAEIDGYDGSLSYLDSAVGALIAELDRRGLGERTLVIVTSDHGESFGNHGLFGHGNSMYRDLIHVPLVIRYPAKVPPGARLPHAVSLQALPATVVDLAGVGAGAPFPGHSLAAAWMHGGGDGAAAAFAVSESLPGIVPNPAYPLGRRGAIKSITTSEWQLLLHEEGTIELFRDSDEQQAHNLAGAPEHRQVVSELGTRLAALIAPRDWKPFAGLLQAYQ
ncbi:MAG: sulfatase [Deltaproteobacteria bacterium]|nr:sulfatase [Deltaproteobacteria bacterium]